MFTKRLGIALIVCALGLWAGMLHAAVPDGGTVLLGGIRNPAMPGTCSVDIPDLGLAFAIDILDTEFLMALEKYLEKADGPDQT